MTGGKIIKYILLPTLLVVVFFLLKTNSPYTFNTIIVVAIIAIFILFKKMPLYVFEDNSILINGIINKKILLSDIVEIRRIYNEELGVGLRFGSRMPGSSIGLFNFESIGEVIMNSNDDNRMVLIKTINTQIIISPDNPDEFINQIKSRS